jgi:CubicO group peptidase (beta-lactamase class C family)
MTKKILFNLLLSVFMLPGMAALPDSKDDQDSREIPGLEGQIDKLLSRYYRPGEPGAVVIAVKKGNVVFCRAYGMADLELGVELRPDMILGIGSVSKPFTATAVMILVERGILSLDDPVTRFIPDYPTQDHTVTIRHLLSHTSGIPEIHGVEGYWDLIREEISPSGLIDLFKDRPLDFSPGEKWNYSNSNYHLLGRIIEIASGQPFQEFLQENVLEPSGMEQTCFASHRHILPRRARGYQKEKESYVNAPYMSPTHLFAAGDLFTTVYDLARFDTSLHQGILLSDSSVKALFTPFVLKGGRQGNSGLGWFLDMFKGRKIVYHGGGIYGYIAHILRFVDEEVFVALLSNRINPSAVPGTEAIARMVGAIVVGDPVPIETRKRVTLSHNELERFAGAYQITDPGGNTTLRLVMVEAGRIFYGVSKDRRVEIVPETPFAFFIQNSPGQILFETGEDGVVVRMVLKRSDGSEVIAKKISE